ncbi:MAG: UvrD-helicase domain-containing protein [Bacteroidales bacterium]|nr:UvrD-helicase domain-containing protein [Bacteroidales bacterium]
MFTTYSASAGAGKTTSLVADFLTLCFRYDSKHIDQSGAELHLDLFQKILGITFTNNAAGEMKDRIVRTLTAFAFEPADQIGGGAKAIYNMVVAKLFGTNQPDPNVIARFMQRESKELLQRILYDYARFTISTIDSFFQRVIRSSAISLKLSLTYSVLIEMDEFYIEAIDQLLNELSASTNLAKRILALLDNSMEETGNLNIDRELRAALDILYDNAEKNYQYIQILRNTDADTIRENNAKIRAWLRNTPDELRERIRQTAQEGSSWMARLAGLSLNSPTFSHWFEDVLNDPVTYYLESLEKFQNKKTGGYLKKTKPTSDETTLLDEVVPHLEDCFYRIRDLLKDPVRQYRDYKIIIKNADKLTLLTDLQKKMEEIKQQNNFFILNESNTLIYETIQNRGYEYLFDRIRFDNFFIDEFQDTSQMQWDDLKPLIINNALANGRDVSLFGDVKQAIYRFRNGDADLFYKLTDLNRLQTDPDLRLVTKETYHSEPLQKNFRSLASVVTFNNLFFKYYSQAKNLDKYYASGLEQDIVKKEPGLVQVYIGTSNSDKKNLASRTHFQPGNDFIQAIKEDPDITVPDAEVLFAVKDALMRGYEEGDIAVLYSGNDNCARMSNLMLKQGWHVITEKALTLNTSAEVNLIIQTLRHLIRPKDLLAQATILHFLSRIHLREKSMEEILFALHADSNFQDLLKQKFGLLIPCEEWRPQPFWILIREIIGFYGLDKLQSPFVVSFENVVLNYLKTHTGEITAFLSWWQMVNDTKSKPAIKLTGKHNAITVSTIHKSKGLEYPVVILPYTSSANRLKPIWTKISDSEVAYIELSEKACMGSSYEQQYLDESESRGMDSLNLLYVAHTRASEMLYIITKHSKTSGGGYGDHLLSFCNNENHPDGGLLFEQDTEDNQFYYFGDRSWKKKNKKETDKKDQENITPKVVLSDFSIDTLRFEHQETLSEDDPRVEGTFVHDFLSGLEVFPSSMAEIDTFISHVEPMRKERLRTVLQHILEDDTLRPCFAPGADVRNEITILDSQGNQHRPDRVVFLPDKVMVIDYKTGQPHEQYQKQIDGYCALLREMGYPKVEGKLLYI